MGWTWMISSILLPPSGLILLALPGLFLWAFARQPWQRVGRYLSIFCGLGLYLFATPLVMVVLSIPLESPFLAKKISPEPGQLQPQLAEAQAIVVLGGGIRQAPELPHGARLKAGTLQRLHYAAFLARQTHLPVLPSGGQTCENLAFSEAQIMADYLRQNGVKPAWIEGQSRNTWENAVNIGRWLKHEDIQTVVLVTEAYHMRRSQWAFEQQGVHVIPAATAFTSPDFRPELSLLLPSASAMEKNYKMLHEYLGLIWYAMRYK